MMNKNTYRVPDDTHARSLTGQPLASFGRLAIALLIDFIIASSTFLLISMGLLTLFIKLGWVTLQSDVNFEFTFFRNWYSVIWLVLYFTLCVYFLKGRTPGKIICGIRIVSLTHDKVTLWHSFERSLGYGASALEFGFGFFQYFIRPYRRTVHDRIAETVVIDDRKGTTEDKKV